MARIDVAVRRWMAYRIWLVSDTTPPPDLDSMVMSPDAVIARRALTAEAALPADHEPAHAPLPGFRGPDAYYAGRYTTD